MGDIPARLLKLTFYNKNARMFLQSRDLHLRVVEAWPSLACLFCFLGEVTQMYLLYADESGSIGDKKTEILYFGRVLCIRKRMLLAF